MTRVHTSGLVCDKALRLLSLPIVRGEVPVSVQWSVSQLHARNLRRLEQSALPILRSTGQLTMWSRLPW